VAIDFLPGLLYYLNITKERIMSGKVKNRGGRNKPIGGDQNIIEGSISGGIITQGRNARVTTYQNSGPDVKELTALFEKLYQHIESRELDPNVDKEEITETVHKIEKEAAQGEKANQTKLQRWMESLNNMAPDILDVILASLGGPISGVTAALKKIAEHSRQ
jgi:hypothetical protein